MTPNADGRFVVTGCAGFIGSHLVEALLHQGNSVIGIDAFTDYYPRRRKEANLLRSREHAGFQFVEADITTMELASVFDGVAGVFHLAAQPGVRGSWASSFATHSRHNVVGSQRIFEAAAREGVRVLFASSSSVYGNAEAFPTPEDASRRPTSPYGVTKLSCEYLADAYRRSFGLDFVALRYFTVYGPRQRPDMALTRAIAALLQAQPFHLYGDGSQSRDFTFVDDAVSATVDAMSRAPSGVVYNVGGGAEATLAEIFRLCENLSGRRLKVVEGSPAPGDVTRTAADTTRIRAEIGWVPRMTLSEGLLAQLSWAELILEAGRSESPVHWEAAAR